MILGAHRRWRVLLTILLAGIVIGYLVWRHYQIVPLPASDDIQRVRFGIDVGWTSEWYDLPLATGQELIDMFRGSFKAPYPPVSLDPKIFIDPGPPFRFVLRIWDKRGTVYELSFFQSALFPSSIFACSVGKTELVWEGGGSYQLSATRVPQLRQALQRMLSTTVIAGGRQAYHPGEDDQDYRGRITHSIAAEMGVPMTGSPNLESGIQESESGDAHNRH